MWKAIKLIILAAVLIGAVIGLVNIFEPGGGEETGPTVSSPQANEWKEQINMLCEKGKWNVEGYDSIATGIHTDRAVSDGELISIDEENALQKYLFTASCNCLNKQVNELFKQTAYPYGKVKSADEMLAFLRGKVERFAPNSHLSEASGILSEYHRLMSAISFSGSASYSRPLRAFNAMSDASAQSCVKSLKYYNSHFSKNSDIRSKVSNLSSNRAKAESDYYSNLEKEIERHSKSVQDINELLEDQERFNEISTNAQARESLYSFINNENKWR